MAKLIIIAFSLAQTDIFTFAFILRTILTIGFDFDGVIIYNPLHVARGIIAWVKKRFLGLNKTSFYKPRNKWQFLVWRLLFFFSIPARGGLQEIARLKQMGKIRPILLTGRFYLSREKVRQMLESYGFPDLFDEIITNDAAEQPHEFKERVIREKKFDIYVEDNIDICVWLKKKVPDCKIYWIYNIVDQHFNFQPKFPHLKTAVKNILSITGKGNG